MFTDYFIHINIENQSTPWTRREQNSLKNMAYVCFYWGLIFLMFYLLYLWSEQIGLIALLAVPDPIFEFEINIAASFQGDGHLIIVYVEVIN